MIGAGHAIHQMTKSWLEKRTQRAEARGMARGMARILVTHEVVRVLARIYEATPGSSYRVELEGYLDRMLAAFSNGEKFDEPMPDSGDQS